MELTTPFPLQHFRPASRTLHFELSTMIGSFAISGSEPIMCRNVLMAASESSKPSSMLTSRMFAPPATWSRATTSAPRSRRGDQGAKRFDPVTFVRSPTTMKFESGRIVSGSRSRKLREGGRHNRHVRGETGHARGDRFDELRCRSATAAHDVDPAVAREPERISAIRSGVSS
jgi:hypothetical protein